MPCARCCRSSSTRSTSGTTIPDKLRGLPTGFTDFDKLTGGLRPGDLVIVAGRPSMGKTTLAVNMAEYAAVNPEHQGLGRHLQHGNALRAADHAHARPPSAACRCNSLRSGRISDEDWVRITGATSQLSEAKIFIDETPALTPTELRARARRVKREHGLDLVVVDYLQLMQVPGTKENRATEISEISRGLKALAKELHVPVIALSQLNRSVEQREHKKPVMSDLRESGAIEQDADMILLIYREEVYDKNTTKKGIAEIDLAKHRNGEIGTFLLTFQGQYTRFANYAPDSYAEGVLQVSRLIRAVIDTRALRSNLNVIRAARRARKVMAVVKANAYGHGLVRRRLRSQDADAFAVARLEEGLALRAAGITQRIVLLEGVFSRSAARGSRARTSFDLVVHDPRQIELLEAVRWRGTVSRVWLKIDTGMNRLGFRPRDFPAALERIREPAVRAARDPRLMTHLACADERDERGDRDAAGALSTRRRRDSSYATSIANSAGLLGGGGRTADWVRPGLALYGVSPFADRRRQSSGCGR